MNGGTKREQTMNIGGKGKCGISATPLLSGCEPFSQDVAGQGIVAAAHLEHGRGGGRVGRQPLVRVVLVFFTPSTLRDSGSGVAPFDRQFEHATPESSDRQVTHQVTGAGDFAAVEFHLVASVSAGQDARPMPILSHIPQ